MSERRRRHARHELIRRSLFGIELDLQEVEGRERVTFALETRSERKQVSGDERGRPDLAEELHHQPEDLLALRRVRSRAELVEDDQSVGLEPLEEASDPEQLGP